MTRLYCEDCGALVALREGHRWWPESRMFCVVASARGDDDVRLACPVTLDHVGAVWEPESPEEVLYTKNTGYEQERQT